MLEKSIKCISPTTKRHLIVTTHPTILSIMHCMPGKRGSLRPLSSWRSWIQIPKASSYRWILYSRVAEAWWQFAVFNTLKQSSKSQESSGVVVMNCSNFVWSCLAYNFTKAVSTSYENKHFSWDPIHLSIPYKVQLLITLQFCKRNR